MTSRAAFRRALGGLVLFVLGGCPTDQRDLSFAFGNGSGSSTSLDNEPSVGGRATSDAGAASGAEDGGDPAMPAGASATSGGAPGGEAGAESGGAPASGAPATGGGSPGGTPSVGGMASSGSGGGPVDDVDGGPCGDIDRNGVQDCDETVVGNARFDSTAQSWVADGNIAMSWQAQDARGRPGSGALQLKFTTAGGSNGWALVAAAQCVTGWSEKSYEVGARVKVPEGQGDGRAEVSLAIFGNDDCQGTFLLSKTAFVSTQTGGWQALHGSVQLPPGARSVLLRLAATKVGTQPSLEVQFDDVLFREK